MKIFKRNKDQAVHNLLSEYGWDSYSQISRDFDADGWSTENMQNQTYKSFKYSFRIMIRNKLSQMWFRSIVRRFSRIVTEIDFFDDSEFVEEQRYKPRAENLLDNSWVLTPFGIYMIEYTIVDRVAYSFYSSNYGLRYSLYMETELTKDHKLNVKAIVNLIKETEEYLFHTIKKRSAH
jgi:hypothetical protein